MGIVFDAVYKVQKKWILEKGKQLYKYSQIMRDMEVTSDKVMIVACSTGDGEI